VRQLASRTESESAARAFVGARSLLTPRGTARAIGPDQQLALAGVAGAHDNDLVRSVGQLLRPACSDCWVSHRQEAFT
jgi:hypothetical protein